MIIEGYLQHRYRKDEIFPLRHILIEESTHEDVLYLSVPHADVNSAEYANNGPFIGGGDVLVYNKEIFVGNSGNGSDELGWKWLQNTAQVAGLYCSPCAPHA